MAANVRWLAARKKFKKQMYMTDAQIKTKAEAYGKQYYSDHQARTIAEDGYMAGYNDSKHLLQQNSCTTLREIVAQEFNRLRDIADKYEGTPDYPKWAYRRNAVRDVLKMIDERPHPNGVNGMDEMCLFKSEVHEVNSETVELVNDSTKTYELNNGLGTTTVMSVRHDA